MSSRAAVAQLCSTSNKLHNLIQIAKCAGLAKKEGASMLFLPECFGFIGSSKEETLKNAENINPDHESGSNIVDTTQHSNSWHQTLKETVIKQIEADNIGSNIPSENDKDDIPNEFVSIVSGLRIVAQTSGLWISGGGFHEKAPPVEGRPRVYNTHIIMDSSGSIISSYRKIHLFDVSIPSRNIHLRESDTTCAGNKLVVCDSPLGKLGLSTCYDVRFPEMYTEMARKGGAEILLIPSAFTVPTGTAHWHTLLRARAIENQCYVLGSAQCGRHNHKRESYGHSLIIDSWGSIISDAGGSYDENELQVPKIILGDLDLKKMKETRETIPVQTHAESSTFSW